MAKLIRDSWNNVISDNVNPQYAEALQRALDHSSQGGPRGGTTEVRNCTTVPRFCVCCWFVTRSVLVVQALHSMLVFTCVLQTSVADDKTIKSIETRDRKDSPLPNGDREHE